MEKEKDEMTSNPQNQTEKEENTLFDGSATLADEKQGELEKDTEQSVAFALDEENLVKNRTEIEKTECAPCEENASESFAEKQGEQVEISDEKQVEKTADSSKKEKKKKKKTQPILQKNSTDFSVNARTIKRATYIFKKTLWHKNLWRKA